MAWIESHDDIWDHHKIYRLCAAVNQPDYAVVGRLHSLWHFVLRNAWKDANLEPWGVDAIEKHSRWDGEKGVWFKALQECGFLDGFVVHGWIKRAGRLVYDRRRNEKRRQRLINGGKTAVKRRKTGGKSEATLPNPTLPNPTKPKEKDMTPPRETKTVSLGPPGGSPPKFIPPTPQEAQAYAKSLGFDLDGEKFVAHYAATGWVRKGGVKIRDWRAAVVTWKKNGVSFATGPPRGGSNGDFPDWQR